MRNANRIPQIGPIIDGLKDIVVDVAKAFLGEIRRAIAFGVSGGLLGAAAGAVGGLMYGFPVMASIGVGAVAGLVVALVILAAVSFVL